MKVCIKTLSEEEKARNFDIILHKRLPENVVENCKLKCEISADAKDDYYLLKIISQGQPKITCLRCMEDYVYIYENETVLAICKDDIIADSLKTNFECVVANPAALNLEEILTDDLYLYLPEKHSIVDCSASLISQ